jgi:hypothetical protein
MRAPGVMVSSTCYDLSQIRKDLAEFIAGDLGYRPILSDLRSFPIEPNLDAIENCCRRVEEADIMVLVVGGRYGSVVTDRAAKSVTNLEYITAKKKGIPVYVFVDKQTLVALDLWKDNPKGDFSSKVDTPLLFTFIEEIKTAERTWVSPFESAQDIIDTLRHQFAYIFGEALKVRLHLAGGGLPSYLDALTPTCLRIALERPRAWEYRLFLATWIAETKKRADLIREYDAGLAIGVSEAVSAVDAQQWFQARLKELKGLAASGTHLMNVSAQAAFGPPGLPGNPEEIIWSSRMIGKVFDVVINWTLRIRRAHVQEPFENVAVEMARFTEQMVKDLQTFPHETLGQVEAAAAVATPEAPPTVRSTLTLTIANVDGFNRALEAAKRQLGI